MTILAMDWRNIKKVRKCDGCSKDMALEDKMNYWCLSIKGKLHNVYLCSECASKLKHTKDSVVFPGEMIDKISRKVH